MKDSLKSLLNKFPYFLDKNPDSNFYKTASVINDVFKDFRQELFNAHLSHRLSKQILVWKEQEEDYNFTMKFYVHLQYLKKVNVYKNSELIYTESYSYDEAVDTFFYSYDDSSDKVIPSDKYYVAVETFEEYILRKGFPENDTSKGNIYDHDPSLDEWGALYDIPRKSYVYPRDVNYGNTEPPYNNRKTEDDYHYMNRILGYIAHMQDTPLPVLEIWKLYGIPLEEIELINRERYLCKMFSSERHGGDEWVPQPWEHKDPMACFWPEPIFFFVNVDNNSPIYGQTVNFTFSFLDMYGESKGTGYTVDAYLDDVLISTGLDPTGKFSYDTTGADDTYPLVFKFIANPIDERYDVLESDDLFVTIKGCSSADWYVATTGNDSNPGTIDSPFKTVRKALRMVEGSKNTVVLKEGTFPITGIQVIDDSTSIISCQGATIENSVDQNFFKITQGCSLYLAGITLKHNLFEMYGEDTSFLNNNLTDNPVFIRAKRYTTSVTLSSSDNSVDVNEIFTLSGTLSGVSGGGTVSIYRDGVFVTRVNTNSSGVFSKRLRVGSSGTYQYKVVYEGDSMHEPCESEPVTVMVGESGFHVLVDDLTTYQKSGEEFVVTVKEDGVPVEDASVSIVVNGVTYSRTTGEDGTCKIANISNLSPDVYQATVTCGEVTVSKTITILSRFSGGSDVTKYELGSEVYTCTVLDRTGSPVASGTSIGVGIGGVTDTYSADSNGMITVPLNQAPDEYILTVSYDGCSTTNDIVVLPRLIAEDLTKYEKCSQQYVVEVLDATGQHVSDGTSVSFSVGGMTYTKTTTSGYATLNSNFCPDDSPYTVTVSYSNVTSISNTITVLPRITANDLVMDYGDGSQFVAHVVDCNANAVAGETVTFNIDGTISTATTDGNGEAKLAITLPAGTYYITSKLSTDCAIINTITVRGTHNYDLDLTCATPIIQTGGSASVVATLTDNSVAVSGVTLDYEVKHGSTTISSGTTSATDANGQATISYNGTGVGDVDVIVSKSSMSLQETFVIEDCVYYNANPTNCSSCNIDLPSKASVSFLMSKPVIGSGAGGVNIQLTDSSHTYFVGNWSSDGNNGLLIRNTGSSTNLVNQQCTAISANTEYLMGVTYNNGSWTYFKDTEVKSVTANYTPTKINVVQIQQGYMKDLKVKVL